MRSSIIILTTFSVFLFSSCVVFHSGFVADSASLGPTDYVYIEKDVTGVETATYILGFGGGLEKPALVANAKKDLEKQYMLKDRQALANVSVSFQVKNFILITIVTCTVSADIVEFKF